MPPDALGKMFQRVARHMPASLARTAVARHVAETCETLGPETIDWLIKNERSLSSLVNPDDVAGYQASAAPYRGMDVLVTDEDFWNAVPEWAKRVIRDNGDSGQRWFDETRDWIRSFFKEA